ncbi:MAG: hypothetical protein CM15mP88_3050 [Pseudomonadota bacterium]|nr:MAG: hypothetical protein CM15mP88_3050 [Pseudomonadota bacterium]
MIPPLSPPYFYILNKCGLKPNMILKALESRLVKPVAEHRGWKRIRSRNTLVMEEGTFWFVGEVLDKFSGL